MGTADADPVFFQGLTQGFQYGPGEFGQFIQKQDSVMSQRDFSRLYRLSASREAGCRYGVVGRSIGPFFGEGEA